MTFDKLAKFIRMKFGPNDVTIIRPAETAAAAAADEGARLVLLLI